MITTTLSLNFPQKEKDKLAAYIKREILSQMYDRLKIKEEYLQSIIRDKIKQFLENSSEVEQLKSNKDSIRYSLGVLPEEVNETVVSIISRISQDIFFQISKEKDSIVLKIGMIKEGYLDILGISSSYFISSGRSKNLIPWLAWLLLEGDQVIFDEYRVKYVNSKESRTGGAVMVRKGSFRIPPQLSGTAESNFITKALVEINPIINREVDGILS
jgi:hypothetical protein